MVWRPWLRPEPLPGFPPVMLWAWDQPEDFHFLDPAKAGVAFLARTVVLRNGPIVVRPRIDPLSYPPATPLMAVVQIESAARELPPRENVIREILPAASHPGVRAVQMDFHAADSEQYWYYALLVELRQALPPAIPLTITARPEWCRAEGWIAGLPVADACPMLFRVPPGEQVPAEMPLCSGSAGILTSDPPAGVKTSRMFFRHPLPWTADAYEKALRYFGGSAGRR